MKDIKIELDTDFHDYYDEHLKTLDGQEVYTLHRRRNDGVPRKSRLELLSDGGFRVPPHGRVARLVLECGAEELYVVYLDDCASPGCEKLLLPGHQALAQYPAAWASLYMLRGHEVGLSYLYVVVGTRQFWLRRESADHWQSTVGRTRTTLLDRVDDGLLMHAPDLRQLPLYAIEFIPDRLADHDYLAIDITQSPRLAGTGIEQVLSPEAACAALRAAVAECR